MALFKIEKGLATNLLANRPNAVEGYCYFTTDDGKFYIDTKSGSLTGSNPTGTRVALNANYASKLLFGEITQSSSSTLKVSTVNNLSSLVHGTIVVLKNNGSNTAANANLNINNLGSKPIYVNGNPITANTWRANEVAILFYDANSYSGTTGVWSLIPGVTYIHPQYTARTGVPTANQTPAFGGTFSVNQITSDSTGHVTAATSRTITIPSTLSNGTGTAGLIKTSSTVTSNSGYTACPVINGVPYYKDTNTTYTLGSFGINATATELNYSSGLTGNIQTQLNNKSSSTHTHNYAGSSSAGGSATSIAYEEGTSNQSRHVWFSHASSQGKLVYDNDFKYNPSTNVLTVGSITGTAAKATSDGSGNNIVNTYATKTALKSVSDLVGSTSVAIQISNALTTANTYTDNKIASLVDSAPETLNTLNELAAALGDDANFSTTVLNQIGTKANANHTHNYAGSSSAGGSANSAVKLDTSAGDANTPVYFSGGKPVACTYTLGKSVPSDAKFTDTDTKVTQTAVTASGYTNWRPLVIGASNNATEGFSPTSVTDTTFTVNTISCQPSSGTIKATTFKGNASTATKLKTARTIGLGTGATGTATSFDGSGNITIPVTSVKEAYLDWGGKNFSGTYGPIDAAMVPNLGANRLAFMPATGVEVQYSTNGGSTWQTYSTTNENKINLFNGNGTGYYIGASSTTGIDKSNYQLRIIITTNTAQVYTELNKFIIYCSTNGSSGSWCTIDGKTKANVDSGTDTWVTFANKVSISGWSGYNVINTSKITTYGNTSAQYQKLRFTFGVTSHPSSSSYSGLIISKIMAFGGNGWTTPSTMAATGRMYTYDYAQNVTFPAKVTASQFNGTATTASKVANTLTIQGNGTTLTNGTFDGSAAKTVNITPASIGAAASSHTHDNRYYTESEIDNYNLITTSEIDNICQIPVANIDMDYGNCSSDISFEEAKSYIENFGRLYVYVTGIDSHEHRVNWVNIIHTLENNNTQINIENNNTGVYMSWYIEWTSSYLGRAHYENIPQ